MHVDTERELQEVYAEKKAEEPEVRSSSIYFCTPLDRSLKKFHTAVLLMPLKKGCIRVCKQHDDLILMGQDIAEYGGVFKITEGFVKSLVRSGYVIRPLCESAILGASLGLSLQGYRSMIEMRLPIL